jgi:hypothetical protein
MTSKKKRWTHEEDCSFVDWIDLLVVTENIPFNDAVETVAIKLERTAAACKFRWFTNIQQHLEGSRIAIKLMINNPTISNKSICKEV